MQKSIFLCLSFPLVGHRFPSLQSIIMRSFSKNLATPLSRVKNVWPLDGRVGGWEWEWPCKFWYLKPMQSFINRKTDLKSANLDPACTKLSVCVEMKKFYRFIFVNNQKASDITRGALKNNWFSTCFGENVCIFRIFQKADIGLRIIFICLNDLWPMG